MRRSALHWGLIAVCVGILAVAAVLAVVNSPYLGWDHSAPETAVMGVAIHAFEWGTGGRFPDAEKSMMQIDASGNNRRHLLCLTLPSG